MGGTRVRPLLNAALSMQSSRIRTGVSWLPRLPNRFLTKRGATMVEYALLIIAIMFLAAIAYKNLGKSTRKNADVASGELLTR